MSDQQHTIYTLTGKRRREYENCLASEFIPFKKRSYFVLRANQFIRSTGNRDPAMLSADTIGEVIGSFARDESLQDWQFAQLVEAVRILFVVLLKSDTATNVDWSLWRGSVRNVSSTHATVAKENTADELLYLKVKSAVGPHAEIRKQHRQITFALFKRSERAVMPIERRRLMSSGLSGISSSVTGYRQRKPGLNLSPIF